MVGIIVEGRDQCEHCTGILEHYSPTPSMERGFMTARMIKQGELARVKKVIGYV